MAGQLWTEAVNPYGPDYYAYGLEKISKGHIPVNWVYPPTWWVIATPFGRLGLSSAFVFWNVASIAILFASSIIMARSLLHTFPRLVDRVGSISLCGAPLPALSSTHFFLMAILEATAIHLSVGQTSAIILFGISLLICGLTQDGKILAIVGLTIVLLKPQMGIIVAGVLFLFDRNGRKIVVSSAILSLVLCIPAYFSATSTLYDFLQNVLKYDDVAVANLPASMTGIRHLVWEFWAVDIGNLVATIVTLGVAIFAWGTLAHVDGLRASESRTWKMLATTLACIIAMAPLHVYDVVLVALPIYLFLVIGPVSRILLAIGVAVIWRSENLAVISGFQPTDVDIFSGSRLVTIGAMVVLVAIVGGVFSMKDELGAPKEV